ncbi:MAG: hypothetical protein Ct9H300mP27_03280 [Chloroflexota bacterium]|nr:MAG: hypothetical protein Ct9H300mP27_03280 [Chloroflexota bacterium]
MVMLSTSASVKVRVGGAGNPKQAWVALSPPLWGLGINLNFILGSCSKILIPTNPGSDSVPPP